MVYLLGTICDIKLLISLKIPKTGLPTVALIFKILSITHADHILTQESSLHPSLPQFNSVGILSTSGEMLL